MIGTKYKKKTRVNRKTRTNRKTRVNRKRKTRKHKCMKRIFGGSLLDEGVSKSATVAVNGRVMSLSEFLHMKKDTPEAFLYV